MNSRLYNSPAGKVFDIFNYVMLGILGILTVLPFLYIIGNSFATEAEITERSFFLIPKVFSFSAYEYIFSSSTIFRKDWCFHFHHGGRYTGQSVLHTNDGLSTIQK